MDPRDFFKTNNRRRVEIQHCANCKYSEIVSTTSDGRNYLRCAHPDITSFRMTYCGVELPNRIEVCDKWTEFEGWD